MKHLHASFVLMLVRMVIRAPTLVECILPSVRKPEPHQAHIYTSGAARSPHIATGEGLHKATTGTRTSFEIRLMGHNFVPDGEAAFMYVWIASADHIFIAEVVRSGKGILTATYESSFPGNYLIHIEEVVIARKDQGRRIVGSPFSLTVTGAPTLDVHQLPVCGTQKEDISTAFWRPGSWISSNIASAAHGVERNGWVFQPKTCIHDTFTYEDLMLLASLEEPTWLLVLGSSVQRGMFQSLVDMVLTKRQKNHFIASALAKCWGYADVTIGNLRLTFQDFRLYEFENAEDSVVCDNEKLSSGDSSSYVLSCEKFLTTTVFRNDSTWPTGIFAPSYLINSDEAHNLPIEVILKALPPSWQGRLLLVDHMAALGVQFGQENPTMTTLQGVNPRPPKHWRPKFEYERKWQKYQKRGDHGLEKMRVYQENDPRVSFMSAFPMYQAKLFENQFTKAGIRSYGASVHYHYVGTNPRETYNGERMISSTMTEMLAHVFIGNAVGTKAALHEKAAIAGRTNTSATVGEMFTTCTDCPAKLTPHHVKSIPEPVCQTSRSLSVGEPNGGVWDGTLCPSWCMAEEPVSLKPTGSGYVNVRVCSLQNQTVS